MHADTSTKDTPVNRSARAAQLNVRCSTELKAQLERLAVKDKRSLSDYVQLVLQEHVNGADEAPHKVAMAGA